MSQFEWLFKASLFYQFSRSFKNEQNIFDHLLLNHFVKIVQNHELIKYCFLSWCYKKLNFIIGSIYENARQVNGIEKQLF